MEEFSYAHNQTGKGERQSATVRLNTVVLERTLLDMQNDARKRSIPVADSETLNLVKTLILLKKPQKILELGTAIGLSGAFMLNVCAQAHLTTVEKDESFFNEALKNFKALKLENRVDAIFGDAGEVINTLDGKFDFIFLDCAKVQYIKYLPVLKELLNDGGVLVADDVLLYGWVLGECPPKRKMLIQHIREYLTAVTTDTDLQTTVLDVGDGVAVSVKVK